jgi:hypothetical protein
VDHQPCGQPGLQQKQEQDVNKAKGRLQCIYWLE